MKLLKQNIAALLEKNENVILEQFVNSSLEPE